MTGAAHETAPSRSFLWIAVWRDGAADIRCTVCRLLIDIHFGLAHSIPNGLDALVGLFTNNYFLSFAGALFDNWLLVTLRHLRILAPAWRRHRWGPHRMWGAVL